MKTVITVAELNRYLAARFKEDKILREVYVKGEISNFARHDKSRHLYFTLKDSDAAVKAQMPFYSADKLGFSPENGMSVIVTGYVEIYEKAGDYRLYCTDIVPDGIGKLSAAYEQLKNKLSHEGLFDAEKKKPLPPYPEKIGVITSEGAAALQDMIAVLRRRAPYISISLYKTAVQGATAAKNITEQIKIADESNEDLLILGRGGGSYEDLFPFSDETVVRAVAGTKTPIISAVGHETDNPLCDFAADLRAPTPSAAAELAVKDTVHILMNLENIRQNLYGICAGKISRYDDDLGKKESAIKALLPTARIARYSSEIEKREEFFRTKIAAKLSEKEYRLNLLMGKVDNLSPLKLLSRGYAITEKDGSVITSAKKLAAGDDIILIYSDGKRKARVLDD
ncbi:MAG: exodeoxyribonuclease VII large subunit [Ruminococcus sp.]|jgi:exodeoxyribonuclease VII large subunit|nr:exodeoxyribonuclease VII large subunit [Ruminococcus sp.]